MIVDHCNAKLVNYRETNKDHPTLNRKIRERENVIFIADFSRNLSHDTFFRIYFSPRIFSGVSHSSMEIFNPNFVAIPSQSFPSRQIELDLTLFMFVKRLQIHGKVHATMTPHSR